jgi:exonuclease SbcC
MPALLAARDAAAVQLEAAIRQRSELAAVRDALLQCKGLLDSLAAEGRDVETRYAVLGRLSEVANGNNPRRMTFQRFVLATLLDEVLEAASLRLLRMSRGRYALQRVREQGDQRVAGGLDLEVFDHDTGGTRPANTLSGGEGFLASLSLALGLADVVQSRAGGIQLDTLFVDEGFGTLDPESLDFAIRTLLDLQQAGRLVGIISHVTELRERIDVRLESGPAWRAVRPCCACPEPGPRRRSARWKARERNSTRAPLGRYPKSRRGRHVPRIFGEHLIKRCSAYRNFEGGGCDESVGPFPSCSIP